MLKAQAFSQMVVWTLKKEEKPYSQSAAAPSFTGVNCCLASCAFQMQRGNTVDISSSCVCCTQENIESVGERACAAIPVEGCEAFPKFKPSYLEWMEPSTSVRGMTSAVPGMCAVDTDAQCGGLKT